MAFRGILIPILGLPIYQTLQFDLILVIFNSGEIIGIIGANPQAMFTRFFFNRMSPTRKLQLLQKKGTFIGNRMRGSRLISLYMLSDYFVEVVFKKESSKDAPEQIRIFSDLENLSGYLEQDARFSLK